MKLIAQLKLKTDSEQSDALRETIEAANSACDWFSAWAWEHRVFGKYRLQQKCYPSLRSKFGLSSQVAIRVISKVADAYKLDKKTQRTFKPLGSIAYDDRILTYFGDKGYVSIWTTRGRLKIPYVCGERQKTLLASRQGESDLLFHRGRVLPSRRLPSG